MPITVNTALWDTIQPSTSQCSPIRHYTALYQSIQAYTTPYSPIPVHKALYHTIQLYTTLYSLIPVYTVLYGTIYESYCVATDHDIIICGVYIPPHNSPYFSVDLFEELEKDVSLFTSRWSILLLGDMNARTGKYNDFLDANDKEYLITDTQEISFTASFAKKQLR